MAEVLNDLLGLPLTPSSVNVLEGRQYAPGDALGCPHHPLESDAVEGGAVAIPGGDASRQNSLNVSSVEVCVVLGAMTNFFSRLML